MRPRCLLLHVDRLPTISEIQESDGDEGDADTRGYGMEQYMDSIRELSQPPQPCYPLHGPLRGHRRWGPRAPPCSPRPQSPGTYAARSPVQLSDVSFTVRERVSREFSQHVVDRLVAQTVFAGL